jgi:hypothetical protein
MFSGIPDNGDQHDMSLGNISDFEMRRKVAELMAIAPALPVRGLHRLLVDLEGDLPAARKQAIRASRAPSMHPSIKSETPSAAGSPQTFTRLSYDADGDEILVKIDPNDGFLEWVSTQQNLVTCATFADSACQRVGFRYATSTRAKSASDRDQAPESHQNTHKT